MNKFYKRFRELKETNQISQRELAKLLNVSQPIICLYLNGKREPTIEIIIKICKIFNVSADYLLGLTDY